MRAGRAAGGCTIGVLCGLLGYLIHPISSCDNFLLDVQYVVTHARLVNYLALMHKACVQQQ
jgi:hypothetical protein